MRVAGEQPPLRAPQHQPHGHARPGHPRGPAQQLPVHPQMALPPPSGEADEGKGKDTAARKKLADAMA
mgnify:CR=1 FL=1